MDALRQPRRSKYLKENWGQTIIIISCISTQSPHSIGTDCVGKVNRMASPGSSVVEAWTLNQGSYGSSSTFGPLRCPILILKLYGEVGGY